ncbi:MAG: ceramidase domain-containing protein, partial [Bacteriovoracia bacterium]
MNHEPFGPGCPWYDLYERFGPPNIDWCEQTICAWINEPANTWSNLLFLILAITVGFQVRKHPSGVIKGFAPTLFLMGLFSLIYHATNNYLSQIFDFLGMFLFTSLILMINVLRIKKYSSTLKKWLIYLSLILANALLLWPFPMINIPIQFIIVLNVMAILVTEFLAYKIQGKASHYRYVILALILIITGEIASLLDLTRIWCDPHDHIVQGHAL